MFIRSEFSTAKLSEEMLIAICERPISEADFDNLFAFGA